jgi:adenylate cyclase
MFSLARHRIVFSAGLAALLLIDGAVLEIPDGWREHLRENAIDIVLGLDQRLFGAKVQETGPPVIVVDIDRHSLEQIGPWPWPREKMADLADMIAAANPLVTTFDILFAEPDDSSPAALARRLAKLTGRSDVADLAKDLPDGDVRLAAAFRTMPVVLGFLLDPEQSGSVREPTILSRGPLPLVRLWRGAGALGPPLPLVNGIAGMGALSLPANADGVIRNAPLFVGAGQSLLPGLALETVRVLRRTSAYTMESKPPLLGIGDVKLFLPPDGLLRLLPVMPGRQAGRTLSAVDVIRGTFDKMRISGAVVMVGGSAPELGGLRETPGDPLTPDVQIQADAVVQILAGRSPRAVDSSQIVTFALINVAGLLMLAVSVKLPPVAGSLLLGAVLAALLGTASSLSIFGDRLLDPLFPSLGAIAVFAVSSISSYAITLRREALVRRRFEQHLAPAVVRRIVEEPDLIKLKGERRQVTALFTDVEGFTAMTHRASPEQLVAVLRHVF